MSRICTNPVRELPQMQGLYPRRFISSTSCAVRTWQLCLTETLKTIMRGNVLVPSGVVYDEGGGFKRKVSQSAYK